MGMDSETRELLTLWGELSPEGEARMLEKGALRSSHCWTGEDPRV
jgi:hypothetical protein